MSDKQTVTTHRALFQIRPRIIALPAEHAKSRSAILQIRYAPAHVLAAATGTGIIECHLRRFFILVWFCHHELPTI
jgi:hypothetical protein